jgi:uncharacterized membrane protein
MWKRLGPVQKGMVVLLAIFGLLLAWVLLAPLTLPSGSVIDLSGRTTSIDNADQIAKMNPFAAAIYYLGDSQCHQLASRSYYLNGNQMPFCARDLGIFMGLVAGVAIALVLHVRPKLYMVVLGFVPMVLDGGLQLLTSYESSNPLRLATGLLAGMSTALLLNIFANWYIDKLKAALGTNEHST